MAAFETDRVLPLNDLSQYSYYRNIESTSTYTILGTLKQTSPDEKDGKVRILLLAGPKITLSRFVRLVSFFLIVFLFGIYHTNIHRLLDTIVYNISMNNTSTSEANLPIITILIMPILMSGLPHMLSLLFGFFSDYTHYQRVYLLTYSLWSSTLSALFLMLSSFSLPHGSAYPQIDKTTVALVVLSILFYILGVAMFLPIALAYGLDLLGDTSWEVKYLYFPMIYVLMKLAKIFKFVDYFCSDLQSKCVTTFSIMLFTLVLFFFFRVLQIFPIFDKKRSGFEVISFRKAMEIFWNALKVRCSGQKSPRGHWFIQLSSDAYYGKYPRKQVQMVASLFEIHFLFLFLLFTFIMSHMISKLYAKQGSLLCPSISYILENCLDEKTDLFSSLTYFHLISFITIILCTPFIEYYFYQVIFYSNSTDSLKNKNTSVWQKVKKCLRCLDRYWLVCDPILKRIFWGFIFALISIVCAFSVEIARKYSTISNITSHNSNYLQNSLIQGNDYNISNLSVFSQVPQYIASRFLEILSYIGCLQFVYFQSASTYKENLLGHFFGLFYFYYGLAISFSSLIGYLMYLACHKGHCFVPKDIYPVPYNNFWVLFVVVGLAFLVVIILFAWFVHYRHYQLSKMKKNFVVDEEG